jgi:hypothetical protein
VLCAGQVGGSSKTLRKLPPLDRPNHFFGGGFRVALKAETRYTYSSAAVRSLGGRPKDAPCGVPRSVDFGTNKAASDRVRHPPLGKAWVGRTTVRRVVEAYFRHLKASYLFTLRAEQGGT